jgi:tetratricopeptide (TPR) repeat protein
VGSFLFVGALAVAGVVLSLRKRAWAGPATAAARFATGYLAVVTLSIVPFFVTDRYRHHLVPAALVLAGLTLERLWALFRGDRRAPGTLALALALGFTVVNLPAPHMSADKYAWGLATDLGQRWAQRGRWDLAVQSYERAIAVERSGALARLPGSTAATERSDLYYDYANALTHVGRDADAVAAYERAVAEGPDRAQAVRALHCAIVALEFQQQRERTRRFLPVNAGKPWSDQEDAQICNELRRGINFEGIAKAHNRTVGSIIARLVRLGKISATPQTSKTA